MSNASTEHEQQTLQGVTFAWAVGLLAMFGIVGAIAFGHVAGEFAVSQVEALAAGSVNAIGLVAIGGVNAIGVLALGMVNAVGVMAVGGVNSIGLISIGGYNSTGLVCIGGVNCYSFGARIFAATIYQWSPQIHSRS